MENFRLVGFESWQRRCLHRLLPSRIEGLTEPIQIELLDIVRRNHYDSLWYGGLVAQVRYQDKSIDLVACGEVRATLWDKRSGDELDSVVDKNAAGEFESVMKDYIRNDKELYRILRGRHRRYDLVFGNNNWWECFPSSVNSETYCESWVADEDGIWQVIAMMTEVIADV